MVLSSNPVLRKIVFICLYFAQGIFDGLAVFAIPAWLASKGKTVQEIAAYLAIILIPWGLKIFVAPVIDRYANSRFGRKRPWIIFAQLGILIALVLLMFGAGNDIEMNRLTTVVLLLSFFTAFQDVATDGLVIEIAPESEHANLNALMWGVKIVSTSLWLFVGTRLFSSIGFASTMLIPAIVILLIFTMLCFVRESSIHSEHDQQGIQQITDWKELAKQWLGSFNSKNNLFFIAIICCAHICFSLLDNTFKIFTIQELDWTNEQYASYVSSSGLIAGISGMILGAIIIKRFGPLNTLKACMLMYAVLGGVIIFNVLYAQHVQVFIAGVLLLYLGYTLLSISVFVWAMKLTSQSISASQFTIFMTFANLGLILGPQLLSVVQSAFSWTVVLFSFIVIALCNVVLILLYKRHFEDQDLQTE